MQYVVRNIEQGPSYPIIFYMGDLLPMHDDPLVSTLLVSSCEIRRVLFDNGSSSDLMYLTTLVKMGVLPLNITKIDFPLVGFNESIKMLVSNIRRLPASVPGAIV